MSDEERVPRSRGARENGFILNPNQYIFVQSESTGDIKVYKGPCWVKLEATDNMVVYEASRDAYRQMSSSSDAIRVWPLANEESYVVLLNPAEAGDTHHPSKEVQGSVPLQIGRKVIIHGAATFPLWPGQSAEVVPGHTLRSNQFLLVRVYNPKEAMENWRKSVMQAADTEEEGQPPEAETDEGTASSEDGGEAKRPSLTTTEEVPQLKMGQLMVIKGSEISFYMPSTGLEVVKEPDTGNYVRNAVSLERLEYCILLGEDGSKKYVYGPAVVFPDPTQSFKTVKGRRKFRAVELDELTGIHVKVIEDYEEDGRQYKRGEELFITGKEQRIYLPRAEHSIITRGGRQLHRGVNIPPGRARYLMNIESGQVKTIRGPKTILPDPRKEVLVCRVLSDKESKLWFSGSKEVLELNRRLQKLADADEYGNLVVSKLAESRGAASAVEMDELLAADVIISDDFERSEEQEEPYAITLGDKTTEAVAVDVPYGFAVMVVNRNGDSQVVIGPQTVFMEYDQTLFVMALSTGTPKSTARLKETVFLNTMHNRVTDEVEVETSDRVPVRLKLSYRVNFEGETPEEQRKWFSISNYVEYLTDRIRSLLRKIVKGVGIEEMDNCSADVIRDAILGKPEEGKDREGRHFDNNMRIYDVEVLEVEIGDEVIRNKLREVQHKTVQEAIAMAAKERVLEEKRRTAEIDRQLAEVDAATAAAKQQMRLAEIAREQELNDAVAQARKADEERQARLEEEVATLKAALEKAALERQSSLGEEKVKRDHALTMLEVGAAIEAETARERGKHEAQELRIRREQEAAEFQNQIMEAAEKLKLALATEANKLDNDKAQATHARTIEEVAAMCQADVDRTKADAERFAAIDDQLTAALNAVTDRETAKVVAEAIGPMHFLLGKHRSLPEIFAAAMDKTRIGETFKALAQRGTKTARPSSPSPAPSRQPADSDDE